LQRLDNTIIEQTGPIEFKLLDLVDLQSSTHHETTCSAEKADLVAADRHLSLVQHPVEVKALYRKLVFLRRVLFLFVYEVVFFEICL
jgi:hypothetical protein